MNEDYIKGWDAAIQILNFGTLSAVVPADGCKWYSITQRGTTVISGYFKDFATARFEAEKRGYYDLGYEIYWRTREGNHFNFGLELCIPAKETYSV